MFIRLFVLEWRSFYRSAGFGKGIAVKLLLGFFALYFLTAFFVLGVSLFPLLKKSFPDQEPIQIVNKFLLVWFCLSFVLRLIFQNLPLINSKPLLIQNIRRGTIVHYALLKTIYSFWNWLFLVAIIPFTLFSLKSQVYSGVQMLAWFVGVLGCEFIINYLNLYVSKNFTSNFKKILPFCVLVLVLYALEYFDVFSVTNLFGEILNLFLLYPFIAIVPVMLVGLSYFILYRNVAQNLYLDAYLQQERKEFKSYDLSWTNRFGAIAPYLQLDLKLLWRAKRAKNVLIVCVVFLAYGLIFYGNDKLNGSGMLIFVGVFLSGIFIINFGQFVPAWDSSYYPLLMSQNITMRQYLESKAILMYVSVAILAILSTPYVYFGWDIFWINISCAVYNLGINVPLILYFGSMNRKRIDLDNGSAFNYQGMGLAQWLVGIPLLLIPIAVWSVMKATVGLAAANAALVAIGVIGFLLKGPLLNYIASLYTRKKYIMLKGFKEVNN